MKRRKSLRETKQVYRTRRAAAGKGSPKQGARAQQQKEIVIHKIGVEGKQITFRVPNRDWLKIIERDDSLYKKYARQLEAEHKGEFVAIGLKGALIVHDDMTSALTAAVQQFGKGNFALRRVGYDYEVEAL
jgi:hypothetical protein